MRIAICNTFGRFLGGVESYLAGVIAALAEDRHQLAMVFETDSPAAQPRVTTTHQVFCCEEIGVPKVLRQLRQWCPDIMYIHAVSDARLEQALIETAPAVLFAHDYSATCISGTKTLRFPRTSCCSRRLGAECLMNYLARRCGGISPITMWRDYRTRLARLEAIKGYDCILVASEAMQQEYLRHGFGAGRVELVRYPVARSATGLDGVDGEMRPGEVQPGCGSDAVRLLFAGRMVQLKGGAILLRALPQTTQRIRRPLRLTMAGDGPARTQWEAQARLLCAENPCVSVEFTGWLGHNDLQKLFRASDLLVVPSLWPEPFGMIGPEAGSAGLPAVAFAVGGIPEWLHNGINGFLAPANPPSAAGLAAAIAKSVADPVLHQQLRKGARSEARRFRPEHHVERLLEIFTRVVAESSRQVAAQ
jgi:glycosyltransferase involved in cell wall biosynthesis